MASDEMATAHFDGRHIHSANTLTVYLDGVKICSYNGGSTCSVKVRPGNYTERVLVYNDAAEKAYWLGPFQTRFEPGVEYDIAHGKSDRTGQGGPGDIPPNASYEPDGQPGGGRKGGYGCLLFVLAAVLLVGVSIGSFVASYLQPSSSPAQSSSPQPSGADPEETQDPEHSELPPEGSADEPDAARGSLVFPDSDIKPLAQEEIEALSDDELTGAINELYARHGYSFHSEALQEYYGQFNWYAPRIPADEFTVDVFNQTELSNWKLLVEERDRRAGSS